MTRRLRLALLSGALLLGVPIVSTAFPRAASASGICNYVSYISQNVAPGGIGGLGINLSGHPYWSGSFVIDDANSGASLNDWFSTSLSNGIGYVDFVNSYSTTTHYAGWVNVFFPC